jgi:hypothetical protein
MKSSQFAASAVTSLPDRTRIYQPAADSKRPRDRQLGLTMFYIEPLGRIPALIVGLKIDEPMTLTATRKSIQNLACWSHSTPCSPRNVVGDLMINKRGCAPESALVTLLQLV